MVHLQTFAKIELKINVVDFRCFYVDRVGNMSAMFY